MLSYHNNSLFSALRDLFPEISIDKRIIIIINLILFCFWDKTNKIIIIAKSPKSNRRKFFITFARSNQFDPLIPENWYNQSKEYIKTLPVRSSFYSNSINNITFYSNCSLGSCESGVIL